MSSNVSASTDAASTDDEMTRDEVLLGAQHVREHPTPAPLPHRARPWDARHAMRSLNQMARAMSAARLSAVRGSQVPHGGRRLVLVFDWAPDRDAELQELMRGNNLLGRAVALDSAEKMVSGWVSMLHGTSLCVSTSVIMNAWHSEPAARELRRASIVPKSNTILALYRPYRDLTFSWLIDWSRVTRTHAYSTRDLFSSNDVFAPQCGPGQSDGGANLERVREDGRQKPSKDELMRELLTRAPWQGMEALPGGEVNVSVPAEAVVGVLLMRRGGDARAALLAQARSIVQAVIDSEPEERRLRLRNPFGHVWVAQCPRGVPTDANVLEMLSMRLVETEAGA